MFAPLVLVLATNDASAQVAVVQGVNDNVAQTQAPNGEVDRHPATFTGLSATGTLRISQRDTDIHTISLRARSQAYVGLDSSRSSSTPPNGTVIGSYTSNFVTSKRGSLSLSATSSLTAVASARTGDGNLLLTLDPTSGSTVLAIYSGFASYAHALAPRWTLSQSVGAVVTTNVSGPPIQAANGVVLERKGIDSVLPAETTTLSRELSARNTGFLSLSYRYIYSPYSLDIASSPPRLGGPQRIHQVVPSIGLTHVLTDTVTTTTAVGISVATPPRFEEDRGLDVFPVGSQQVLVVGRKWRASALASASYGTVAARLGSGPVFSLVGTLSGAPLEGRRYRSLYLVAVAQATHTTVPSATAGDGSVPLEVVGASAEIRYGLTRYLGLYTGYDVRLSSQFDTSSAASFRQILFIGVSGYWTTDGNLPPIETTQSPYTPG